MVITSRDGHRSHGHSHHLPSCHPSGSAGVRKARGHGRSYKGRHRSRHHHVAAGQAAGHSGRPRNDGAAGSRRSAADHRDAAADRNGRHACRRSSAAAGSDDGSRHGEGCSHEEDHGGRSSRPWEVRGSRSRGHGSPESGSGSEAHEDGGSRIAAVGRISEMQRTGV